MLPPRTNTNLASAKPLIESNRIQAGTKTLPPLSRPGAWAYPDMLEVGNLEDYAADEAHFGLWVVTSSPLILGFDMLDDAKMERVWPIITNKEVSVHTVRCPTARCAHIV